MIVRAIDETNDWMFGKGTNSYKRNQAAVIQNIKTRIQEFLGDCFFAPASGIDWFSLLGSKNQIALNLAVAATILKTEGVTKLVQLYVTLDTSRLFTVSYEVETIYSAGGAGAVTISSSYLLTEAGDILATEAGDLITG